MCFVILFLFFSLIYISFGEKLLCGFLHKKVIVVFRIVCNIAAHSFENVEERSFGGIVRGFMV